MTPQAKRESLLFVGLTYLLTAFMWGTLIVLQAQATTSALTFALYLLGGLSPTIVALLLPLLAGKETRKDYYRRFFRFKVSWKWYALPVAIVAVMALLPNAILLLVHAESLQGQTLLPWYMLLPIFVQMIVGGGLEELGWRGILVHNLRHCNRIAVGFGVGVIWACWHIPLFFIPGVSQYQADFLPFFFQVIALSFITAILYLSAKSVVPCVLLHALVNTSFGMGFTLGDEAPAVIVSVLVKLAIVTALLVASGVKGEGRQGQPVDLT